MRVEAECSPDYTTWVIRVSDAPAGMSMRQLAEVLNEMWNGPGPHMAKCSQCGKLFPHKRSDAKTCSGACRNKAHRRRSNA